jgi:hypothetical protein
MGVQIFTTQLIVLVNDGEPTPSHKIEKKKKKRKKTRGVSHCGLAIYIKKVSSGKRRIMETQIFHHKNPPNETKILQVKIF